MSVDCAERSPALILEEHLGDPGNPENTFSFKRAVELDEREEYPEDACRLVLRLRFLDYLIPAEIGGSLRSHEDLLGIVRVVSRRDLTVAIAHGQTFLGALAVWIGGNAQQKKLMASIISEGNQAALALTEEAHGSDILANGLVATRTAGGFHLSGEKWLINNGTRGRALIVQARTDPARGGPRGYSLFLVDKQQLDANRYSFVPRKKTLGIRGADISGIRFESCFIPDEMLLGQMGCGLDLTLRALQVSRTLCAGFSLGAADTALRTTLRFALSRRLYGDTMFAIPHTRRKFVDCFVQLLICEHVSVAAARALHAVPSQLSIWSSVVKYFVPTNVEELVRTLSVLLGARSYLRESHDWGVFQKLARDQLVVGLFDGSTIINLQTLGLQLQSLCGKGRQAAEDQTRRKRLESVFCLSEPLPTFDGSRLEVYNRGVDDVVQGIELSVATLKASLPRGICSSVIDEILALSDELLEQVEWQAKAINDLAMVADGPLTKAPELFSLAHRYCVIFAAAACLHMWVYNRTQLGDSFAEGTWLALCLEKLLTELGSRRRPLPAQYRERMAEELLAIHEGNRLFSARSFELAPVGSRAQESDT